MMKMLVLIKLMMSTLSTIPISSTMLIIMNDRSNHQSYVTSLELCDKGAPEVFDTAINIHDLVSKGVVQKTNTRAEES